MIKKFSVVSLFLSILFILFSCGTEEEIVPDTLTVSANATQVFVGRPITFNAVSQNNGSVTSTAIFFVNGQEIEGNTFIPESENDANTVYATWSGLRSNTLQFASAIEVVLPDTYTKKVLVEDYTGTWCGYCPGMTNVLEHFSAYSENVIPVAIHCDDDPYQFEFQRQLQAEYGTIGLPKAQINRVYPLNLYVQDYIIDYCGTNGQYYQDMIQDYIDEPAPLGLAIDSELNGDNLNFQVQIGFLVDNVPNAKLVVYLLEDGLIHDQVNYFAGTNNPACEYSTYPATIPGYEHNYVLQKSFTHIFGDEIPAAEIVTDGIYTRDFNVAVPANVENNANLSLVAFVMGNENNEVINAQTVRVGQNQEFD